MNITLLNVNHSTKTAKNGKPYQIAEVAYKNNTYGGKVEGFKVTSYMKAYADVAAASIGDTLEVAVEKGNTGFNEWTAANKAIPGVTPVAPPTPAGGPSKATTAYTETPKTNTFGRDFETKDERAKKQVYIVRQSSLGIAVSTLAAGAKQPLNPEHVIATAKQYEAYVFEQQQLSGFEDMPNDFPNEPQVD